MWIAVSILFLIWVLTMNFHLAVLTIALGAATCGLATAALVRRPAQANTHIWE